jgi:hypothetical protein
MLWPMVCLLVPIADFLAADAGELYRHAHEPKFLFLIVGEGVLAHWRIGRKTMLKEDELAARFEDGSRDSLRMPSERAVRIGDIPSLLGKGGFRIEQVEAGYLSPFPKSGSYCWWGVAIPEQR